MMNQAASRYSLLLLALVLPTEPLTADDKPLVAITVDEASADPDFAVQGEYTGENVALQVVALGDGEFRTVLYRGGLPGDGWDETEPVVSEEDRDSVQEMLEDLELEKVRRESPTLGREPPEGAVVLFDGTRETFEKHWAGGARMTDDGLLEQGATSKDTFRDFTFHLEFLLSYIPHARDQGRGNSGVYYQGRYETQILDSFGLEGKNNEAGGIYEISDPDLNMCFPPLTWQTYDVDFTAARFDADGKKTADARMTVRLNGVVVQNDVPVPRTTRAAPVGNESAEPGPIYIQNHGNPIRFRNIWVLPRDMDQEARRPIIPGYERIYGAETRFFEKTGFLPTQIAAGRLLAGELGCTACHAADPELNQRLLPKQAPILTDVGRRIQHDWIYRFIGDPHTVKPGTTMPNLLADWSEEERRTAVRALASFLASTGSPGEERPDRQRSGRGEQVFHQIGCTACHAPRNGTPVPSATSVPLVFLEAKYTIPSLAAFLKNPHAVRPSGRMPSLNLNDDEARDLAHYLLGDLVLTPRTPNMRFAAYHGSWDGVPDFDKLEPVAGGECEALDLNVGGRANNFGVRYDGFLRIETAGTYTFYLGSDDGSLLFIDGEKVVDTDGVHPHVVNSGSVELDAGMHPIRVEYQQAGGEWTLALEYEGPGVPRQDGYPMIGLTEDPACVPAAREAVSAEDEDDESDPDAFVFNLELIEQGRRLFASVGCANCHQLDDDGAPVESSLAAKPLSELRDGEHACLRAAGEMQHAARRRTPHFELTRGQRDDLASLLTASAGATGPPSAAETIHATFTAFNCLACHSRNGVGGPEPARNTLFQTTIPEMGDEGRVPPPLDGVGDKLTDAWLNHVLQNGADDRPYMLTRMPAFRPSNAAQLASAFVELDRPAPTEWPAGIEPQHRLKSTGRELVGDQALACIKCHTFGPHRATGIQSIDLLTMHRRLREDWFRRYLFDPQQYRSGTRMPTGFPNGIATIKDKYDGEPQQQIGAIWEYLRDGDRAGIPDGLIAGIIELKPVEHPIIYRNFIEGLSPRGIAVGYPEHCNLAWDADRFALTLIWHGRFIDASKHWVGRGPGTQRPLGDHVMTLEPVAAVAALPSLDAAWPTGAPKEQGYHFRGYRLNERREPEFQYEGPGFSVTDFPAPVARNEHEGAFRRRLTIRSDGNADTIYFRAAVGDSIERVSDGEFLVDGVLRIGISDLNAVLRNSAGRNELLVPVDPGQGPVEIVQTIEW
jgi:mono/diheme cytochrome c family protein